MLSTHQTSTRFKVTDLVVIVDDAEREKLNL